MPTGRRWLAVGLAAALLLSGGAGVAGLAGAQSESTDCSYPLTVTDATGTAVTVEAPPERVVTLAPSAAQTMHEIDAWDKVVGISDRGTYLADSEDKAIISGAEGFVSTEKVVAQEPGVVLAPAIIGDDKVAQLREAGLTVYNFEAAGTLDDVAAKTRLTGQLVGACEGANERAGAFENTVATVERAVEGEERPTVLYLLGGEFTAGDGTFIDTVIESAGGTNVAAEANITGYKQISREVVANQGPEYIVVSDEAPEVIPQVPAYNGTPAVQNDQILTVNANYLNQPAPRTEQVLKDFASEWHPAAYDADAESLSGDTTAVTTATETPGFGPIVALVAILLGAFRSRDA